MRLLPLIVTAALLVSACGSDVPEQAVSAAQPSPAATPTPQDLAATVTATAAEAPASRGTVITVRDSEFGRMLFDNRRQAIYIFENDRPDESRCYDECAVAWPPVFSEGEPVAGKGTDAALLGTTKRRDGKLQVTYAGQPLYYYAHEGPGEVRCHNINLNGGLWWVVGPDGKRRP